MNAMELRNLTENGDKCLGCGTLLPKDRCWCSKCAVPRSTSKSVKFKINKTKKQENLWEYNHK